MSGAGMGSKGMGGATVDDAKAAASSQRHRQAPIQTFMGTHSPQRIVLDGGRWAQVRHWPLSFEGGSALQVLNALRQHEIWATSADGSKKEFQLSLGFTRQGLERSQLPAHVLSYLALKAPAFYSGAAARATKPLHFTGANACSRWEPSFQASKLDAVITLHAKTADQCEQVKRKVLLALEGTGVRLGDVPSGARLQQRPDGNPASQDEAWVHFGYRDSLSRMGVRGFTPEKNLHGLLPHSIHEPGEFLLGHRQNQGANPWASGKQGNWNANLREFFLNGSFGVFQVIEQDVAEFERYVLRTASQSGITPHALKALLCGRQVAGKSLAIGAPQAVSADFDYHLDPQGRGCPLASHARRMNPRGEKLPHSERSRPLIRRGMTYGPPWAEGQAVDTHARGLLGHFFCASIEEQYEHLWTQWGENMPLGSRDRPGARDPLFGSHQPGDAPFRWLGGDGRQRTLEFERPFTTTRGLAYLFYPSLRALEGIVRNELWADSAQQQHTRDLLGEHP